MNLFQAQELGAQRRDELLREARASRQARQARQECDNGDEAENHATRRLSLVEGIVHLLRSSLAALL